MKIVVCIKQVPDTAEVKLDPKTNTLIRDGVPSIINQDGVQRVLTLSLSEEEQKRFAESCQLLRENYKGILDDNS